MYNYIYTDIFYSIYGEQIIYDVEVIDTSTIKLPQCPFWLFPKTILAHLPLYCSQGKHGPHHFLDESKALRPPMETPELPSDIAGAAKKAFLTPHDIPRILRE